jgi:chromosome segregation ATPase
VIFARRERLVKNWKHVFVRKNNFVTKLLTRVAIVAIVSPFGTKLLNKEKVDRLKMCHLTSLTKIKYTISDDIESILRALEKKYEVDLNELRKLLKTLSEDLQKREKELNRLRNFSDKVDNNISKETKAIKKLKEDVQKVEDLLKLIGSTNSHENLLKHLREIKNLITNLVQKLKKLKFQDDKANFQNIIKKLRDINNQISKMNENFPKIQKDSLNLALATEDDIQLLKSVIFKYNGSFVNGDKFRENLTKNTEWIESDLLALFNILNNYQNVSLDSDELIKNASNVRFSANETQLRLDRLLKDHKKLEDLLKVIKSVSDSQFFVFKICCCCS